MTINPNPVNINKFIPVGQLFNSILIISKRIIPQIVVSISMVIVVPHRAASPVSKVYNNKSKLGKSHIFTTCNRKEY